MTKLNINGKQYDIDLPADTPLLWVLRDEVGLTGTKFGCGMALCGACTVHIDGRPGRACITPISSLANKKVVTIEGGAGGVDRPRCSAMRILPVWPDHVGNRAP